MLHYSFSYCLQQAQAFYTFPFQQMMAEAPNMAVVNEQQMPEEVPAPAPAQEPVQEASKGRKRKPEQQNQKNQRNPKNLLSQEIRFNGVSEAELLTKTLPRYFDLQSGHCHCKIFVLVGFSLSGLMAAYKGHHYPGLETIFVMCLFMSGLSEVQLNHMDDHTLPGKYGIGFTNMVERTTPGSKDLSSKEFREGGRILVQKLQKYQPRIAVFNGKCIYEIFSKEVFGVKVKNLEFGLQPHKIPDTETLCYVMPSSSARCAQFPRAQDKVHYYIKLKDLRDQLKGIERNMDVQEVQYTFDLQLAQEDAKKMAVKEEKYDLGYEAAYGGAYIENPCNSEPCSFSSNGLGISELQGESAFSGIPNGQWMTQSFTDQIPSFNNHCGTQEQEEENHA
uniref:G/T mismatch-specific thymine DNA glycosylase n=1 Tax=Aotus nancymaae TaxID=37293 RepID=A0A2K5F2H6_AOTNA